MTEYFTVAARRFFVALLSAIEDAWGDTRRQINEEHYHNRIIQTAFGQFLFHNVMNRVYGLGDAHPGISVALMPNCTGTAYHAVARIDNIQITLSAVANEQARPRPALYRTDYATRQGFFTIDDTNILTPSPPTELDDFALPYVQILYGPAKDNRQELGFIMIAFVNRFNEYDPAPMHLDDFLAKLPGQEVAAEDIAERFIIGRRS